MKTIKEVLMTRDRMSEKEADELIDSARQDLWSMLEEGDIFGAEEICSDYFGLEPDYLEDLLW